MAGKKSPKNGAPKRGTWRGGTSKKKKPKAPRGKYAGDIVLGPVIKTKVRVPINAAAYAKKESEIAQLEVKVKKLRAKIKPDQVEIREHRKAINELTEDIEDETEERDVAVRNEYHYNTFEVRVLRADDKKLIEKRTMTAEERQRPHDVEDEVLKKEIDEGAATADEIDNAVIDALAAEDDAGPDA